MPAGTRASRGKGKEGPNDLGLPRGILLDRDRRSRLSGRKSGSEGVIPLAKKMSRGSLDRNPCSLRWLFRAGRSPGPIFRFWFSRSDVGAGASRSLRSRQTEPTGDQEGPGHDHLQRSRMSLLDVGSRDPCREYIMAQLAK